MILKETKPALDRLAAAAVELNEASDAYQAELVAIEKGLQALNLGLEASADPEWDVPCSPKEKLPDRSHRSCTLSFRKHGDSWRLLVSRTLRTATADPHCFTVDNPFGEFVPLLDTSRETRIGAAPALLNLIQALHAEVEAKTKTLRRLAAAPQKAPKAKAATAPKRQSVIR